MRFRTDPRVELLLEVGVTLLQAMRCTPASAASATTVRLPLELVGCPARRRSMAARMRVRSSSCCSFMRRLPRRSGRRSRGRRRVHGSGRLFGETGRPGAGARGLPLHRADQHAPVLPARGRRCGSRCCSRAGRRTGWVPSPRDPDRTGPCLA
ncbi:hypothetical protein HEB29_004756 [Streptomyces fulvorobeus]|uniref:Uncharacterized protein n=1 Tax=Streptomyces fulvorobeus TaxID=284028 RepID=A0A7Y9HFU9_9ACTN|nr:hypothetical protein [Streptomyces fulvorobeus]